MNVYDLVSLGKVSIYHVTEKLQANGHYRDPYGIVFTNILKKAAT